MSESRPAFRFTQGDWGKHPSYDFTPMALVRDDGSPYVFCDVYLCGGDKLIAQVQMSTVRPEHAGYPRVDNLIEMKANLALMSAAPNLLDACSQLLDEWDTKTSSDDFPSLDTIDLIRAAVSKATTY